MIAYRGEFFRKKSPPAIISRRISAGFPAVYKIMVDKIYVTYYIY